MKEDIFYTVYPSTLTSLGVTLIARSEKGLCAVLVGDDEASMTTDLFKRFPSNQYILHDSKHDHSLVHLSQYVEGHIDHPISGSAQKIPLDMRGTDFQKRVWQALCRIPYGETRSYAQVARAIDHPSASRAVANACAANALAIVIPCHRVLKQDGALSGYRWGVHRKQHLLEWESRQQSHRL